MPSLAATHRALAAQWDAKRNSLSPRDVTAGSHARVWWRCPRANDHVWQAAVYQRAASPGCPFCLGRRVAPSTSLAGRRDARCRKLTREWHPDNELAPSDVVPGSNRRVAWRCGDGHEWSTSVANRFRLGSDCPYCSGRYASPERSLAKTHPALAKEWHPAKNGKLTPSDVLAGSEKKVWWQCREGHEFQTRVGHRTGAGSGCPYCSHKRVTLRTSLAKVRPALAKEWHPTKNGALAPEDVVAGSHKRVWWRCARDATHEWQTAISNRPRTGCPYCAKKRVGRKDVLAAREPALAKELHPTKNPPGAADTVSVRSSRSVWWICKASSDHVWTDSPRNRIRDGGGCPYCAGRRASRTSSLRATHPELAREWHPTKNRALTADDVVAGSGKQVWWQCARGHSWRAPLVNRSRRASPTGCPYCANKKTSLERSLAHKHPAIAAEWDRAKNGTLSPEDVVPGSNKRVWWKCPAGPDHEWETTVTNRALRGDGCPFCRGRRASVTNSLARKHPRLAREWHPWRNGELTPRDVPAGSAKRVWWKCPKGDDHEWDQRVEVRVRYPHCPFCIGVRFSEMHSLAALFPALALEWHPSRNGLVSPRDVAAASKEAVWWRCPRKHSYRRKISERTLKGRGCPVCSGEAG
ncbi:MAG: zinc-ribbon domain-containing protein [Sandaracinaceae bacterium]|nr:zinc-ribbon domain-containing protein [Sandaracinaceae bacterium]